MRDAVETAGADHHLDLPDALAPPRQIGNEQRLRRAGKLEGTEAVYQTLQAARPTIGRDTHGHRQSGDAGGAGLAQIGAHTPSPRHRRIRAAITARASSTA